MCVCLITQQVFSKHYWTPTMCLIPSWALLKPRLKGSVSFPHGAYREGGWQLSLSTSVLVATELVENSLKFFHSILQKTLNELTGWYYWQKWVGNKRKMIGLCSGNLQGVHRRSAMEAGSDTEAGSDVEAGLRNPTRQRNRGLEDMLCVVWSVNEHDSINFHDVLIGKCFLYHDFIAEETCSQKGTWLAPGIVSGCGPSRL